MRKALESTAAVTSGIIAGSMGIVGTDLLGASAGTLLTSNPHWIWLQELGHIWTSNIVNNAESPVGFGTSVGIIAGMFVGLYLGLLVGGSLYNYFDLRVPSPKKARRSS